MKLLMSSVAAVSIISAPSFAQDKAEEVVSEAEEVVSEAVDGTEAVDLEQVPEQVETVTIPPAPKELMLPANTPIRFVVANEVNSSTHKEADTFLLTVAEDVKVDDTVVIPRGTPAKAEITWRTGKGAFGKSGKLEFAMRSIDLGDGLIPISGDFRQDGEGNTVATGVGVLAVGLFAGFITGKRARVPAGRELTGKIAVNVPFSDQGELSADFDGRSELDKIVAATPLGMCKAEAEALEKESKRRKAIKKCYSKRME